MKLNLSSNVRRMGPLALSAGLLILLTFFLHLKWNPRLVDVYPDSGLFMYGAKEVLSGKLLYVDVWDHKPPAIYYLNALAMLILGENPWAIWWLGLIWITIAIIVFNVFVSRFADRFSAFISSVLFLLILMHPKYYQGGNFTEIYALLPQILIIIVTASYFFSCHSGLVFLAGTLTALTFLFKPPYIATGLATLMIILYHDLHLRSRSKMLRSIVYFIGGVTIPIGIVLFYWYVRKGLPNLLDAVILFNLKYTISGLSIEGIWQTFINLALDQPFATIFLIAMLGFLVFVAKNLPLLRLKWTMNEFSLRPDRFLQDKTQSGWRIWTLAVIFSATPIELLFLFLAGRNFGHYYITPLPVLAMGSAYFFFKVRDSFSNWPSLRLFTIAAVIFLVIMVFPLGREVSQNVIPTKRQLTFKTFPLYGNYNLDPLHKFVLEHSSHSDFVLVWHIHPSINFLTSRPAPSRYLFSTHLFYPTRTSKSRFDQFLEDLVSNPPVLILTQEVSSARIPFFGTDVEDLCPNCAPYAKEGMLELKLYIEENYSIVETIGDWLIYERNPRQEH